MLGLSIAPCEIVERQCEVFGEFLHEFRILRAHIFADPIRLVSVKQQHPALGRRRGNGLDVRGTVTDDACRQKKSNRRGPSPVVAYTLCSVVRAGTPFALTPTASSGFSLSFEKILAASSETSPASSLLRMLCGTMISISERANDRRPLPAWPSELPCQPERPLSRPFQFAAPW